MPEWVLMAIAGGLGAWFVFGWLPNMIERSIYRAMLRMEDIKRGGTGAGVGSDKDLGDVVVTIRQEAQVREMVRQQQVDLAVAKAQRILGRVDAER